MMLFAVIRKELTQHLVSFRFISSSVLFVVLATLATLVSTLDYRLRLDAFESQVEQHRSALERVHVFSYLQPVAIRPPEPLSILDRGFEGRLGNEVQIHIYSIPAKAEGEYRGNPYMATFREFDLTTIVQVVLAFQALLLTFDAIVGEKEKKNLGLVLAQSVARSSVLFGKFIGAFLALLIPLIASGFLSVWLLTDLGRVELSAEKCLRFACLFGAYAVYLGVMLLLGLLISIMAPSAPKSLAYTILTWLLVVFLFPQIATTSVRVIFGRSHDPFTVETAVARLEQERDDRLQMIWKEHTQKVGRGTGHFAPVTMNNWNRAVLRRFGSATYYDALADYYREETALGMHYAEQIFELRQDQLEREEKTEQVVRWVTSISPTSLLQRLAEALAGTSTSDHDAFLAECRAYRRKFIEYLRNQEAFESWRWFTDDPPETQPWPTFLGVDPGEVDNTNYRELFNRFSSPEIQEKLSPFYAETEPARLLKLDDLPLFQLRSTELGQVFWRIALELACFFLFGGILTVSAVRRFSCYEPR